jgi:tetratricopeptide (TPR) repeat protein
MDNLYIYKLPGKKLDIRYSGSPVCYSNNNNIVVGMITDNEDENFCLSIPMYIILKKFEVNEVTKWINKGLSLYESGEIQNAIECYDNALKINHTGICKLHLLKIFTYTAKQIT